MCKIWDPDLGAREALMTTHKDGSLERPVRAGNSEESGCCLIGMTAI
jgi:hypothetical protein